MPFKPGQSGNPGGRSKESEALKRLAREQAYRALEVLVAALDDDDVKVRMAAANSILDRGMGKPSQEITGAEGGPLQLIVSPVDSQL